MQTMPITSKVRLDDGENMRDCVFMTAKAAKDEIEKQQPVENLPEGELESGEPKDATAIWKAAANGKYPQWNGAAAAWLAGCSLLLNLVLSLRKGENADLTPDEVSSCWSTMMILGWPGTTTNVHCDRHDAKNLLYGINLDPGVKLPDLTDLAMGILLAWQEAYPRAWAVWVLVSPEAGEALHEFLVAQGYKAGLSFSFKDNTSKWKAPSLEVVQAFEEKCGPGSNGLSKVQIVAQESGTLVTVPPGWFHWVLNLRPCIKVAWDPTDPTLLHKYILVWRDIVSGQIGPGMPTDYTNTLSALSQAILLA